MAETEMLQFGDNFDVSKVIIDNAWTYCHARIIPSYDADRLVVFRPKPPSKVFGCIRVLDKEDTEMIWEIMRQEGAYIGRVPPGSSFEALLVEIKLITMKT
jgi:hypothetical protein